MRLDSVLRPVSQMKQEDISLLYKQNLVYLSRLVYSDRNTVQKDSVLNLIHKESERFIVRSYMG